ncbi:M48 family metallopeptidase [Cucumibacter marinus]|uniref:M48 family metallopeptidase n=1 Tax=Cucumibacter marinus TaxID=1121252 RepID=UPI00048BC74D|nr:SprT family zinc-dependent metalloprotease [Cucumibacter marinus]
MNRLFRRRETFPDTTSVILETGETTVIVRVNARARHYRLTMDLKRGPILTVPAHGHWDDARAFLERHKGWLDGQIGHRIVPVAFVPGAEIPIRGVLHKIADSGRIRGQVEVIPGDPLQVVVPGGEHLARRLTDWLKAEARNDLSVSVQHHAARLEVKPTGIKLRDQSSRWGSCSSSGALNFNWRLVLAPAFVLDYVAAHEVAHLIEMNHSRAFWRTVERTLPDMERGRAWLKAHGRTLHRYGAD